MLKKLIRILVHNSRVGSLPRASANRGRGNPLMLTAFVGSPQSDRNMHLYLSLSLNLKLKWTEQEILPVAPIIEPSPIVKLFRIPFLSPIRKMSFLIFLS